MRAVMRVDVYDRKGGLLDGTALAALTQRTGHVNVTFTSTCT